MQANAHDPMLNNPRSTVEIVTYLRQLADDIDNGVVEMLGLEYTRNYGPITDCFNTLKIKMVSE
jgi:hypothetical protein